MLHCPERTEIQIKDPYEIRRQAPDPLVPLELPYESGFVRNDGIKQRFEHLSRIWHDEMDGVSSVAQKTQHWAYKEVIAMDEAVIPYILDELTREQGGSWFTALAVIAKHNPVKPEHRSDMSLILKDWTDYIKKARLEI